MPNSYTDLIDRECSNMSKDMRHALCFNDDAWFESLVANTEGLYAVDWNNTWCLFWCFLAEVDQETIDAMLEEMGYIKLE